MNSAALLTVLVFSQILPPMWWSGPVEVEFSKDNDVNFAEKASAGPGLIFQAAPPEKIGTSLGIETSAQSVLVWDPDSNTVLLRKNAAAIWPIASVTKLMTALVFLEHNPGFETEVTMEESDQVDGGNLDVSPGDRLSVRDLMAASLIASSNNAAEAMARSTGLAREEFIAEMNKLAETLGWSSMEFFDVTGLDPRNRASVMDIVRLAHHAFNNSEIQLLTTLPEYTVAVIEPQREIRVHNTNELLEDFVRIQGGKTGYIPEAGYNLVVRSDNGSGRRVIIAVFGSASSDDRFREMKGLISWTFENWRWPEEERI
ncbi:MAG: serine hydrolase [bacterium]|nr:serine hydrolase [bacterium]